MKKIWIIIVTTFASLALLTGCGSPIGPEASSAPVTQEQVDQLQEKQAEVDKLKLEKLESDKKELEAELAEKEAKDSAIKEAKASASKNDARYIKDLQSEVPQLRKVDDEALVELGQMICSKIKGGVSVLALNKITTESGFTEDESTSILASAIAIYCPEELDDLS